MTTGLVEQIDSFGVLLQSLPEDPNNTKVRGDAFEQLCQWFLRTDSEYAHLIEDSMAMECLISGNAPLPFDIDLEG